MRLLAMILFIPCIHASAGGFAQNVTLSQKNVPLQKVLKEIKNQTGYDAFFDEALIRQAGKVSIHVVNADVQSVLEICFRDLPLEYKIVEKTIVIKPRKIPVPPDNAIELPEKMTTEIRGTVADENNQPLPGASVLLKGTNIGTNTDARGNFLLEAPDNVSSGTIVVSYVGYENAEVSFSNPESVIRVTLKLSDGSINNIVVTALGISRRAKSLVYTTQKLPPAQFTEVRDPNNILNAFQGKLVNARITQSSGGVGSDAQIILRGNRSINQSNSALIVIDGVPGNVNTINPDDIESITVLPGASAGALYGGEAGNGVIVITTKKGKSGEFRVSVNSGAVVERPFALPEVQNTYGQGNNGNIDVSTGNSWGAKMSGQNYTNHLGQADTYSAQPDNIKEFFRTGVSLNNSVSVSGGTDRMQGYLSYTNNIVQGIVPNNDLLKNTFNLRLNTKVTDWFSTDAKVTYYRRSVKNQPRAGEGNTPVFDIYQIPRSMKTSIAENFSVLDNVGVPSPTTWPSTVPGVYGNPYWAVNNDILNSSRDNITGFVRTIFSITDWLNIRASANIDKTTNVSENKIYQGTLQWAIVPGGYYNKTHSEVTQNWYDLIIEGRNNLSKDLRLNYTAGAIYKYNNFDQTSATANGLNVANKFSLNFATDPISSVSASKTKVQSVFAQFNLSFRDFAFLDGSIRNDWDSRLQAPHAFQYFSLGGSLIVSDLIKMPKPVSYLKANLSYAEVGNGGVFGLLTPVYSYSQGPGNGYIYRGDTYPFPDLKPEIVKSLEAGFDARFLNNRLGLMFTYYKSNSINQLLTISMPVGSGYTTRYINAGNIQNSGVEFVINAIPVKNKNFSWNIDFNAGMNRNKIVKLTDDIKIIYLASFIDFGGQNIVKEGGSYGDILAFQWQKNPKGQYVVNSSGAPLTSNISGAGPGMIGNFNPKATLGLSNTLNFNRFSLRLLIDGRIGGIMISGTEMNLSSSGITKGTEQYREGGWNLGGVDDNGNPVNNTINAQTFWNTTSYKRFGIGEFYAYDITNFRIRELTLGYTLPFRDNFIKSARISIVGRNLLWLYRGSAKLDIPGLNKRKMWFDPDMSLGNLNGWQGIEYGAIPSTRSLGLNLNFSF